MDRLIDSAEDASDGGKRFSGRLLATLCWIQVAAAAIAAAAALYDVESIIGSCPAIAVFGFVIALIAVRRRSTDGVLLGLWCPVVTAVIALLISSFEWSPGEAEIPVSGALILCALIAAAGATVLANRARSGSCAEAAPTDSPPLQFSIRGLLVVTTLLCVLFAAMQRLSGQGEMLGFAIYGVGVLLLSIVIGVWFQMREIRYGKMVASRDDRGMSK